MSLMLAWRTCIRPFGSNSQFSLPYDRNQFPESSCHSYANRTAIRLSSKTQRPLISRYSSSLAHLRFKKATISALPLINSDLFLHRESGEYASATFSGSRVFHPSSAPRTFCVAVSRVNGGSGGRLDIGAPYFVLGFERSTLSPNLALEWLWVAVAHLILVP